MVLNKTLLQQALEAIFNRQANAMPPTSNFATPTVRISGSKTIQPEEFEALAALSQYAGQFPALVRGGEYVNIIFTC